MTPARAIPPSVIPNIGLEYLPSPTRRTCPPACNLWPSSVKTGGNSEEVVCPVVNVVVNVPLADWVKSPIGVETVILAFMLKTTPGMVIIPVLASKFPPGPGLSRDAVTARLAPAKLVVGNVIG